jgi:hypothetical protein
VHTFDLRHESLDYQVSVGHVVDNERLKPIEVFINGPKVGSMVEAIAHDAAVLLSISMQCGVPLDLVQRAVTRSSNEHPSSIIGMIVDVLCGEVFESSKEQSKEQGPGGRVKNDRSPCGGSPRGETSTEVISINTSAD